jgi:hypothetical protein
MVGVGGASCWAKRSYPCANRWQWLRAHAGCPNESLTRFAADAVPVATGWRIDRLRRWPPPREADASPGFPHQAERAVRDYGVLRVLTSCSSTGRQPQARPSGGPSSQGPAQPAWSAGLAGCAGGRTLRDRQAPSESGREATASDHEGALTLRPLLDDNAAPNEERRGRRRSPDLVN